MPLSQAIRGFGTLLKRGDSGAGASTSATKVVGAGNSQIVFQAKAIGVNGNNLQAAIIVAGVSTPLSLSVTASALTINSATDAGGLATSTVNDVIAAVYQDANVSALFDVNNGTGDGSGIVVASAMSNLAGGATGGETFTTIAEVTSLGGPNESADLIEVTHMESDGAYKEFISALHDGGELSTNINFLPGNAGHQSIRADLATGLRRNYRIVYPDAANTTYQLAAYVTGFEATSNLNDKIMAAVRFKISGPITKL